MIEPRIELDKLVEAENRLAAAIAAQKAAVERLETALSETEASRAALHAAGYKCWVDKFTNGEPIDDGLSK